MGASKLNIHSQKTIDIAQVAKVFAHPARVAILEYISNHKYCICGDIVDEIGLSQPTISQHLQVINKAGLLKGNFKGKSLCYCINTKRLLQFQTVFNSFFSQTNDNCC